MRANRRAFIAISLFLVLVGSLFGQTAVLHDQPKIFLPKSPPTRKELDARDSQYRYVEGLACLHEEKYAEALKAFEEAARLDPDAPDLVKAQLPILIALDRYTDALAACKKVVTLDPGDYSIWYTRAKLHKTLAKYPDAIADLENGLKSPAIKNHPEAAQLLYIELGNLYESTAKFGPAADAFNQAAAILEHPDLILVNANVPREAVLARASETYEKIGQLYRKAKKYDDAIAALRKAQQRAPERADRLNFVLAQVCREQGDAKQALVFVDAYLRTQPLSLDPYEMKVDLLRRLRQDDKIVPWLEEASGRDRFNNALRLLLANECVSAKQTKKAEAMYQALAEESPSAELYLGLFRIYQNEGGAGMARVLAMLDKVMDKAAREDGPTPVGTTNRARAMVGALRGDAELARNLVDAAKKPDELKFDTVYFLARLADRNKKTDEAERFYRQCLQDKNVDDSNEAILYGGLLGVLAKARKHEEMVKVCEEGLKKAKATKALLFYNEQARALASLRRYDAALKTADKAVAEAPEAGKLLFQILRIRILSMAERFKDAEAECQKLLDASGRPAEVIELRYLLSNIYSASKQSAKSEDQLKLVLKLDPDNATVNNDLGYTWADQNKNLDEAEKMIRKALDADRSQRRKNLNLSPEDDKDNAAFVDSLGWVLFRKGQLDEARKELERALTLDDGNDPTIHDHLGDVYSRLKMQNEATRAWQRALELYDQGVRGKNDERVRDLRRKIEQAKTEVGGR